LLSCQHRNIKIPWATLQKNEQQGKLEEQSGSA